jgi:hypothetical protein
MQRMLAEANQQQEMPIVEERRHLMANYGLALTDGNPVIIFDTPQAPGVNRKMFPFSWQAFDKYVRDLQNFREEHGPK